MEKDSLFIASITKKPFKLAIHFGEQNSFQENGNICPTPLRLEPGQQITLNLEDKTLLRTEAQSLGASYDCGKKLTLWKIGPNLYKCQDGYNKNQIKELSHIRLGRQGAKVVAVFEASKLETPTDCGHRQNIPQASLKGSLTQDCFHTNPRLKGFSYRDYQLYSRQPTPLNQQQKADYERQLPVFQKEEILYARLQAKLQEVDRQSLLTYSVPESEQLNLSEPARWLYTTFRKSPLFRKDNFEQEYFLECLNLEKAYLKQKTQEEYNLNGD